MKILDLATLSGNYIFDLIAYIWKGYHTKKLQVGATVFGVKS